MLHTRTTLQRTALLPPPSHLIHQHTAVRLGTFLLAGRINKTSSSKREFSLKYVIWGFYRVGGRNVRLGAGHIQRPQHPHEVEKDGGAFDHPHPRHVLLRALSRHDRSSGEGGGGRCV